MNRILLLTVGTLSLSSLSANALAYEGGRISVPGTLPDLHLILKDGAQGLANCGGVLIAQDVLLTAAHCLLPPWLPAVPAQIKMIDSASNAGDYTTATIDEIEVPQELANAIAAGKNTVTGDDNCGAPDIAVVKLGNIKYGNRGSLPVVPLAAPGSRIQPGETLIVGGYGMQFQGEGIDMLLNSLRMDRKAVSGFTLGYCFSVKRQGEWGSSFAQPGDSGSPVLRMIGPDSFQVVGVAEGIDSGGWFEASHDMFTRLDGAVSQWLQRVLSGSAQAEVPAGVTVIGPIHL